MKVEDCEIGGKVVLNAILAPQMVISEILDDKQVICIWFDSYNQINEAKFPIHGLINKEEK